MVVVRGASKQSELNVAIPTCNANSLDEIYDGSAENEAEENGTTSHPEKTDAAVDIENDAAVDIDGSAENEAQSAEENGATFHPEKTDAAVYIEKFSTESNAPSTGER